MLQTFSGVLSENFVGNLSPFSLENAILSSYRGCGLAHYILPVQGSGIGIFYDGQKFYVFDSHARDENGRSCSNGSCILGECSYLADLCFHVRNVVKSFCSKPLEELQYDFHVIEGALTFKRKKKKIYSFCKYRSHKIKAKENTERRNKIRYSGNFKLY